MNTKGFTIIEMVVTAAILITLATVAVPAYGDVVLGARSGADDASVLVLNDATTAYAMLNDMELSEVFDGTESDQERMKKLVDEQYLIAEVEPAQEGAAFEWDGENCKWTVSDGQDSSGDADSGDSGSDEDTGGTGSDDSSGDEDSSGGSGNGNGGCGGHWRWRHGYGWEWYDSDGYNHGDTGIDSYYEFYGYGNDYDEGVKVWYNGSYYISYKSTDDVPGQSSDWQKICDEWYEYNSYEEGDIVTYNGVQYVATKSSCGKEPSGKGSHWEVVG